MMNDKEQNSTSPEQPEIEEDKASTSLPLSPKPFPANKQILIGIVVFILLLSIGGLFLVLSTKSKVPQSSPETKLSNKFPPTEQPTNVIPSPSITLTTLKETKSIDTLNSSALIKVAFVQNGNIYLYEDGRERLVAKPTQKTTEQACFNLVYPFLSPNGKYLAYIEQTGSPSGMGGCLGGALRIVDISTGINKPTNYNVGYFNWTPQNQLEFTVQAENTGLSQKRIKRQVFYNPTDNKEVVYQSVIDVASNGLQTLLTAEYPSLTDNLIRYKDNKYYLASKTSNKEVLLLSKSLVNSFLDWSPDGRYAIFESVKNPTEAFDAYELVIDTQNPTATPKEITVGRGGAGGDFSTGREWYFGKAFVAYCRQDLYFIDGSTPLQLTNDGGGGCHNEDGFVATSPNDEYAFLKFKDRFELRNKDGGKSVIQESTPLAKGRGAPKNLIWLNDDYMAIFSSTYGGGSYSGQTDKPKIYLFDRKANIIKPLIENAYLITSM